jgi:hypothetical protein
MSTVCLQGQYWADDSKPYSFVPASSFVAAFQKTEAAHSMRALLDMPFDRAASADNALVGLSLLHGRPPAAWWPQHAFHALCF